MPTDGMQGQVLTDGTAMVRWRGAAGARYKGT